MNGLLKGLVALVNGGGLAQLLGGDFFGRLLFANYVAGLPVPLMNTAIIPKALYEEWCREIVIGSLTHAFDVRSVFVFLAVVLLLVHVACRTSLREEVPAGARLRRMLRAYRKRYWLVTNAVFVSLTIVFFLTLDRFWLIGGFLLIVVPGAVHLFLYAKDMRQRSFAPRLSWLVLAFASVTSIVSLPCLYGRRVFDLKLSPVAVADMKDLPMRPGLVLLVDETTHIYCALYFDSTAVGMRLMNLKASPAVTPVAESLRELAKTRPPPFPADLGRVLEDVEERLSGLDILGGD